MPSEETLKKHPHHDHHDSDSESDDEEEIENIPVIDVDVTKLTPLSPEVISKQVRSFLGRLPILITNTRNIMLCFDENLGYDKSRCESVFFFWH